MSSIQQRFHSLPVYSVREPKSRISANRRMMLDHAHPLAGRRVCNPHCSSMMSMLPPNNGENFRLSLPFILPSLPTLPLPISPFHCALLNVQIQQLLCRREDEKPSPFSIDSLLKPSSPVDVKDMSPEEDSRETTSYTLDGLQSTDGRSKSSPRGANSRCICDQCGKSYATSSNLSRHKQTHRALDSPHAKQCPHCDRVYVSMPALSMHILTHKASHQCDVCGKMFSRLWLLQGHMRSHTGQRPFGCAHCGKSFADRSNLRAHILTHTGEKRFECEPCGRRFAMKSYLTRHQESSCKSKRSSSSASPAPY